MAESIAGQQMTFDGWGVLELLGHRRHVGRITTVVMGGAPMVQVVALGWNHGKQEFTERFHFYAPAAVYGLSPCTEEEARAAVKPTVYDYGTPQLPYRDPDDPADEDEDDDQVAF